MAYQSDEELYQTYLNEKSEVAFRQLYQRHCGPLNRFVYRFTQSQPVCDELIQDIFTELISGRFTHSEGAQLKSWLYTVARNKSLNWIKKKRKEVSDTSILEFLDDGVDSEAQIIQTNLLERLSAVELTLPKDLLKTWSLRKAGLDNAQIAAELAIPLGTVKSRFFKLVEVIRKEINNEK
jgi:RNA polymerase sigma factor (sigma-70 family)